MPLVASIRFRDGIASEQPDTSHGRGAVIGMNAKHPETMKVTRTAEGTGARMMILPQTDRLLFRDWTPADLDRFHVICADPRVMQFVGNGEPWSIERTQQFIDAAKEMSNTGGYCLWALIHSETSQLIGFCGFRPGKDGAEIGWRLAPEFWGRGLATEAARSVLKYGFETLGFPRVFAHVQSPNQASIRVCTKLGLEPESSFLRDGREVLIFSIRSEDYLKRSLPN